MKAVTIWRKCYRYKDWSVCNVITTSHLFPSEQRRDEKYQQKTLMRLAKNYISDELERLGKDAKFIGIRYKITKSKLINEKKTIKSYSYKHIKEIPKRRIEKYIEYKVDIK